MKILDGSLLFEVHTPKVDQKHPKMSQTDDAVTYFCFLMTKTV